MLVATIFLVVRGIGSIRPYASSPWVDSPRVVSPPEVSRSALQIYFCLDPHVSYMESVFKILPFIAVLQLNTVGVSSQSVTITEDTVYIMNNVVGQVTCTLYGNCGAIVWYLSSIQAPVASVFPRFSCSNRTNGFYQTCDDQNHQYTLYFTGTTNLHGQTLRCSGESCTPQQTVSDTATISIIVPVSSVALEGISGQQITVKAGQSKSITCVTGASRPAPHVLWYIGMTNMTSLSTETQVPSQELFYTRSTLTFIPTRSQNGLQVNCKAYNTDNNMVELSTKPTLIVQYPPNDANAVIKQQGNTISTIEGNSATLVCEVRGGNPLSTITWDCFGLTGTSSTEGDISRSTLNFIAHKTYNRRTCTCRAAHPAVNLGNDSVTIYVYYGPASISYQPGITSYTRNEGENLGPIQCVSDCNPKCNFVWTRPGRSDYNGENLTISGITRRQEGEYKCTTSNSYGSKSGLKISVVVNYGPDQVILTPSIYNYIVNETFQLGPIKCSATCKPDCSYKWIRPKQNDIQGDTLVISSIQRTQTGTYKCQANNTVGTWNSNDVSVTVHYAAKLTNMEINDSNYFTISEHSTKTITCLAEGLPQPKITLTYISNSSIIKSANGLRLDFTFPFAKCEDTGIYRCDAINKFTPQQPLQKEVFVLCQPRAAKEPLQNRYALGVGKTLNITVPYLAYPRPTFQWFKNGSSGSLIQIIDDQDIQINNSAVNTYTFVIQFIRRNLKEDDFGTYILISNNTVNGPKEDVYIVGAKGKPQKPKNGQAMCIDYKSAFVTWKPGFFNGDNQTFSVVYKEKGGKEQISVSNISDPGHDKYINHTVNSLQGAKTYIFTIYSKNTLGESTPLEVNCTTKDVPDSGASTGLAVGAGLGSAIVIILIVAIVIFAVRRFRHGLIKGTRDVEMNGRSVLTSGDDQEDGMRDNILYEPAGPNFAKPGTSGVASAGIAVGATGGQNDYPYAEVQKNGKSGLDNPIAVYAEVQKNPKKEKKPDPSVQKPKKEDKGAKPKKIIKQGKAEKQQQVSGDLYENVENVNKGNFAAAGPALVTKQKKTKPAKPPKAPKRNKDGLIYADLDLEEPVTKPGQKLVIRGLEDRTDYAEIDITRRDDPLPPDDKPQKELKDSMP